MRDGGGRGMRGGWGGEGINKGNVKKRGKEIII